MKKLSFSKIFTIVLIVIILILVLLSFHQCSVIYKQNDDIDRLNNNLIAQNDTIVNYKDKYGNNLAEIHAYQLTNRELNDSIKTLLKKNQQLESLISTSIGIHDTIYAETKIIHDTINNNYLDKGKIIFNEEKQFAKSNRSIIGDINYQIDSLNILTTDNINIELNQNIYVDAAIVSDKKTKETFVVLKTDYPGTVFNSGNGILVTDSKTFDKRKNCGIGIGIHAGIGAQYGLINKNIDFGPYIGVGIQFSYTPKVFQW